MRRSPTTPLLTAVLIWGVGTLVGLMTLGRLTLDARWGRRMHRLGPLRLHIDAPRELVYQQLSAPYLGRTPAAARDTLEVLERGTDMVIARHRTRVGWWWAETVESVRFSEPGLITFRHWRGPVPHAVESFTLTGDGDRTELVYEGEIGLDFWWLGSAAARWWVVPTWMAAVEGHLTEAAAAASERAAARRRREARRPQAGA